MKEVIETFYHDLVVMLPFKDVLFRAKLKGAGLFYGNLKQKVEAKDTSEEMAECFLDYGINNDPESFKTLLTVMEMFDSDPVKNLAEKIRRHCPNKPGITSHVQCM